MPAIKSRAERERVTSFAPGVVTADLAGLAEGAAVRLMGVGDWVDTMDPERIAWPLVEAVEAGMKLRPDLDAWTYTHTRSIELRDRLESVGVAVWASTESTKEAGTLYAAGWRVAVAPGGMSVYGEGPKKTVNIDGKRWPVCPEQTGGQLDCNSCRLCARPSFRRLVFAEI